MDESTPPLTTQDLAAAGGELLPDKEVLSVLDLFVNIDIALDLAAPVDLAVAGNLNVGAPIDAAATANVLSFGSTAQALADQGVTIDQYISGSAVATAPQDAVIDQSNDIVDGGTGGTAGTDGAGGGELAVGSTGGTGGEVSPAGSTVEPGGEVAPAGGTNNVVDTVDQSTDGALLDGPLLNVDVDVALDADLAAPIAGAVAANANVAAPIDAAVAANVLSFDSEATAVAQQSATISQTLDDVTASATADQQAEITQ